MRRWLPARSVAPLVLICSCLPWFSGQAASWSCPVSPVVVETAEPDDGRVASVFRAADLALAKLQACRLVPREPLQIEILDTLKSHHGMHFLGYYSPRTRKIVLLNYGRCTEQLGTAKRFGVPMTPALYQSLVVHEIAHAVLEQQPAEVRLNRVEHEYVAYALQFDAMQPSLRRQILAAYPGSGPVATEELHELVLDISPPDFAARAYRHFSSPQNGCGFLRRLLSGSVRLPSGY